MHCDRCQSTDVVKASVAYEMGTGSTASNTIGLGAVDGQLGVGLGRSRGQFTSEFAERLKPPSTSPSELGCAVGAAFAVFFLIAFVFNPPSHDGGVAILMIGASLGAGYLVYKGMQPQQSAERAAKIAQYDRLWVCLRCGRTADRDEFTKEV